MFLITEKEPLLKRVSKDPQYNNPKLTKLKEMMLKKMDEDSRTIVFCKTRELTAALEKWMNDDRELKLMRPHRLTGANAIAGRGGREFYHLCERKSCV